MFGLIDVLQDVSRCSGKIFGVIDVLQHASRCFVTSLVCQMSHKMRPDVLG